MQYFDGKKYFSKICNSAEAAALKGWTRARGIPAACYDVSGYGSDILFSWWLSYPDVVALVSFLESL